MWILELDERTIFQQNTFSNICLSIKIKHKFQKKFFMNRCSGYEAKDVCTWPPSLVRSRRLPPLQQSSSPYVRRTCLHTLDYKICSISAVILAVIGGQKHPLTLSHLPLDKFKLLKYKFINTWLQIPTKKQKTNFPKYEEWTCIVLIYRYQYFNYKNQT